MPDQEETTTRIEKLERELAALTARVATLESRDGGSPTPRPSFQAEMPIIDDGPFGQVQITGSGFQSNEKVTFFVRSVTRFPGGQQSTTDGDIELEANEEGNLDGSIGVECHAGATTTHTFQAHGALSGSAGDASVSC